MWTGWSLEVYIQGSLYHIQYIAILPSEEKAQYIHDLTFIQLRMNFENTIYYRYYSFIFFNLCIYCVFASKDIINTKVYMSPPYTCKFTIKYHHILLQYYCLLYVSSHANLNPLNRWDFTIAHYFSLLKIRLI